jgi:hypothetical protein
MEQKMVVLKPIAWNGSGYMRPEGIEKSGKDYVALNGFGHEEWNGNPNRMWKEQRVFYTNTTTKLTECGNRGELGIIMTAYRDGVSHALGVATSVQANTEEEMDEIARALNVDASASQIWGLPSVKKRHPNWRDFKRLWDQDRRSSIIWRCPPSQFCWFSNPVPLTPSDLFPLRMPGGKSPDIIKMYGRFQAIRPDQALAVVKNSLPDDSPIIAWLSTGHFDEKAITARTKTFGKPTPGPSGAAGRSSPPPSDPYVRYIQTFEVQVSPRHHDLQKRFKRHIESAGATSIASDKHGIDIQFKLSRHGHVLAEVKPCDKADGRFAVRTAMGQLLDYRHRHSDQAAALLVVLETRPSDEDIDLALSNDFGISYPRGEKFILKWPA